MNYGATGSSTFGGSRPRLPEHQSSLLSDIAMLNQEEKEESALLKEMEAQDADPSPSKALEKIEQGEDGADEDWNAHSHALTCNATATIQVRETLDVFNMLDADRNGNVSVEELLAASKSPYVVRLLRSTNNFVLLSLIRSMEDRDQFLRMFRELDPNDDKQISEEEWCEFVKDIAHQRVCYLKRIGLTSGRCFWGRGFRNDFAYHLYNTHPLLQFCYRDPDYPCSTHQLVGKELVTLAATLFLSVSAAAALGVDARCNGSSVPFGELMREYAVTCGTVTLPVMALDRALFYAIVCPCYVFDKGSRNPYEQKLMDWVGRMMTFSNATIWAALILLFLANVSFLLKAGNESGCFLLIFAFSRLNHYVLVPVAMILQPFNPYVNDPNVCKYTGVGRYNVERKNARRHALKKHESMKDHIGLLAKEVGDAASPVNTERAHKFFKDSMRAGKAKPSFVRHPDDSHEGEAMLVHLDAVVAHHEGGDHFLPDAGDVPDEQPSGCAC